MATCDYSPVISELNNSIPLQMQTNKVTGLSIALIDGKNNIWSEGFGYTDSTKKHRLTADTLFSLQSVSKTCTATGFMLAVDKGLVKLDDPLKKFYPEFIIKSRFGEKEADKITFRLLLCHRSGLTHQAPIGNYFSNAECSFEDHIKSISDSWLKFPVGERYSYSNQGFDLVGYALQRISGKPFIEYMQTELLEPLGMVNSTYDQKHVKENCVYAKGYYYEYEEPQNLIPMIPAGGLFSSAREMAKFVIFHLTGGMVEGKSLISKSTLEEMYKPQFPTKNQSVGHGLGILRGYDSDVLLLHNSGGGYGYATYHIWLPEHGIGVVVLTNQNNHSIHQSIAYDAIEKMLRLKFGWVRKEKPLKKIDFTEKPAFNVKTEDLHHFEGDYWADYGLMQIRVLNGLLHRTLFNGKEEALTPISENGFINNDGHVFTFKIAETGKPVGLTIFRDVYGASYCPLHFSPHAIGPDKEDWRKYTGIYSTQMQGNIIYYSIMMKSGYLYMFREGVFHEHKPSFFFTSEGEAVTFRDNNMNYANIPLIKEINPYDKLFELKEINPEDKRLRKYSLQSLGDAYKQIGDIDNTIKIDELNVWLHPEFKPALERLVETYLVKGDTLKSEEYRQRLQALL